MRESELSISWLYKPSHKDLDPHGSLAKVDKEDVATYYLAATTKKTEVLGSASR